MTGSLPPTPYLTILDHAFNAACLLSVYHVTGLCVINQFQHYSKDTLNLINMFIAIFALLIFLVIHIYLYVRARHFISLYPKKDEFKAGNDALRAIYKSALGRQAMGLDSSYSLDARNISKDKSF